MFVRGRPILLTHIPVVAFMPLESRVYFPLGLLGVVGEGGKPRVASLTNGEQGIAGIHDVEISFGHAPFF